MKRNFKEFITMIFILILGLLILFLGITKNAKIKSSAATPIASKESGYTRDQKGGHTGCVWYVSFTTGQRFYDNTPFIYDNTEEATLGYRIENACSTNISVWGATNSNAKWSTNNNGGSVDWFNGEKRIVKPNTTTTMWVHASPVGVNIASRTHIYAHAAFSGAQNCSIDFNANLYGEHYGNPHLTTTQADNNTTKTVGLGQRIDEITYINAGIAGASQATYTMNNGTITKPNGQVIPFNINNGDADIHFVGLGSTDINSDVGDDWHSYSHIYGNPNTLGQYKITLSFNYPGINTFDIVYSFSVVSTNSNYSLSTNLTNKNPSKGGTTSFKDHNIVGGGTSGWAEYNPNWTTYGANTPDALDGTKDSYNGNDIRASNFLGKHTGVFYVEKALNSAYPDLQNLFSYQDFYVSGVPQVKKTSGNDLLPIIYKEVNKDTGDIKFEKDGKSLINSYPNNAELELERGSLLPYGAKLTNFKTDNFYGNILGISSFKPTTTGTIHLAMRAVNSVGTSELFNQTIIVYSKATYSFNGSVELKQNKEYSSEFCVNSYPSAKVFFSDLPAGLSIHENKQNENVESFILSGVPTKAQTTKVQITIEQKEINYKTETNLNFIVQPEILDSPKNILITQSPNDIKISWEKDLKADFYEITYNDNIEITKNSFFTIAEPLKNTHYQIKIKSHNENGYSLESKTYKIFFGDVPSQPEIESILQKEDRVNILIKEIEYYSFKVANFKAFLSTETQKIEIDDIGFEQNHVNNAYSISIDKLKVGIQYHLRICAVNFYGESKKSNGVSFLLNKNFEYGNNENDFDHKENKKDFDHKKENKKKEKTSKNTLLTRLTIKNINYKTISKKRIKISFSVNNNKKFKKPINGIAYIKSLNKGSKMVLKRKKAKTHKNISFYIPNYKGKYLVVFKYKTLFCKKTIKITKKLNKQKR